MFAQEATDVVASIWKEYPEITTSEDRASFIAYVLGDDLPFLYRKVTTTGNRIVRTSTAD